MLRHSRCTTAAVVAGIADLGQDWFPLWKFSIDPGPGFLPVFSYAIASRNTCYQRVDLFRMGHAFQTVGRSGDHRVTNAPALQTTDASAVIWCPEAETTQSLPQADYQEQFRRRDQARYGANSAFRLRE